MRNTNIPAPTAGMAGSPDSLWLVGGHVVDVISATVRPDVNVEIADGLIRTITADPAPGPHLVHLRRRGNQPLVGQAHGIRHRRWSVDERRREADGGERGVEADDTGLAARAQAVDHRLLVAFARQ